MAQWSLRLLDLDDLDNCVFIARCCVHLCT